MTSYLDQINAFHRYCELKHLSPGSKLLWFTLMDINNRLLWQEWFQVTNNRLMLTLETNKNALIRYRDVLINSGLIKYKKGRKGHPSSYKMLDVPSYIRYQMDTTNETKREIRYQMDTTNATINGTKNEPYMQPKTGTINRHKTKDIDIDITSSTKKCNVDFEYLLNFWNSHRGDMPAIKSMTDSRKRAVRSILKKQSLDELKDVILKAGQSDFLNGRVKEFRASFDWILKPANFTKIAEGNYTNRSGKAGETAEDRQRAAAIDEFEADANNWFYEQETE